MNSYIKLGLRYFRYLVGVGCTGFTLFILIMAFLHGSFEVAESNTTFILFEIGLLAFIFILQLIPIKQ